MTECRRVARGMLGDFNWCWVTSTGDCDRSVARKETLGVHQKNWVCHIYCQINAQKKQKNKHAYWVLIS